MKISYNLTGAERKALVGAISQELNTPVKYLGMPSAAYEVGDPGRVGGYHIDKIGTVTGAYDCDLIAALRNCSSPCPARRAALSADMDLSGHQSVRPLLDSPMSRD